MSKFRFRELKTIPPNHTPNKRRSQDWSRDCLLSEPLSLHHYKVSPFKLATGWGNGPNTIGWNLIGTNTRPNMPMKTTTTKIVVTRIQAENEQGGFDYSLVVWLQDLRCNREGNGGPALGSCWWTTLSERGKLTIPPNLAGQRIPGLLHLVPGNIF